MVANEVPVTTEARAEYRARRPRYAGRMVESTSSGVKSALVVSTASKGRTGSVGSWAFVVVLAERLLCTAVIGYIISFTPLETGDTKY